MEPTTNGQHPGESAAAPASPCARVAVSTSAPSRKRNKGWIWYFMILFVLSVSAVTTLILFNLKQQLKPEQLEAAAALWNKDGPRDYDMTHVQTGNAPGTYEVQVRGGVVVSAKRDGLELEDRLRQNYSMDGLIGFIAEFLEQDARPGRPRTFTVAVFDTRNGHARRYIRRVMGTQERLEIQIQLRRVDRSSIPAGSVPNAVP